MGWGLCGRWLSSKRPWVCELSTSPSSIALLNPNPVEPEKSSYIIHSCRYDTLPFPLSQKTTRLGHLEFFLAQ